MEPYSKTVTGVDIADDPVQVPDWKMPWLRFWRLFVV